MHWPIRGVAASTLALLACNAPVDNRRVGGIALSVALAPTGSQALDSGRVLIRGPTNVTASVRPGTTTTFGDLIPGLYTVALEGYVAGAVDHFGQTSSVQVAAGQNTAV